MGGQYQPNRTLRTLVDLEQGCFMFGSIAFTDTSGGRVPAPAAGRRLVKGLALILESHATVQGANKPLVWLYTRGPWVDFHTNLLTQEPLVVARLLQNLTGLRLDTQLYLDKEVLLCTQYSLQDRKRKNSYECLGPPWRARHAPAAPVRPHICPGPHPKAGHGSPA